jgi:hypothetical protein
MNPPCKAIVGVAPGERLDRIMGQAGQSSEALPPREEGPEAPRWGEDHVPAGDRCQDLLGDE